VELEQEVFRLLRKFENGDKATVAKFKKITQTCVKGQEKILSGLDIHYNYFDYESSFIPKTKEIISLLEKTGKLEKDPEGRIILNQKGTSVEGKMKSPVMVLKRSDDTGLYSLRDLAYTIYKIKKSKNNFIVLGEDQKLYFEQLSEALKLLNFEAPRPIHYSFILLKEKNKSKKMSTRKGEVVLLEDFINLAEKKAEKEIAKRKTKGNPKVVAISAVKYSILKNNSNKSILFDLDESLSFEGDTGPYLLYSYARASSILKKSKIKSKGKFQISKIENKELELCKKLSEFPEVIENSFSNLNPSHIANYSYSLAQIFNEFYHECPVINSENEKFRISLVESFRIVLKNSLNLLGISVLTEM
jgi:arginyl-tRNA synthetase